MLKTGPTAPCHAITREIAHEPVPLGTAAGAVGSLRGKKTVLYHRCRLLGTGLCRCRQRRSNPLLAEEKKDYVVLSTLHPFSLLCPSKCLALPPLRWLRTSPLFHHTHGFFPCYYQQYCNRLMTKIVFFSPSVIFLFFFIHTFTAQLCMEDGQEECRIKLPLSKHCNEQAIAHMELQSDRFAPGKK